METELQTQQDTSYQCYDSLDTYLVEKCVYHPFPQTEFQCNHFVSESHPTTYRQVRQTLLEISTRKHSLDKINISIRKAKVEIERLKKKIEECTDEYDKQLYQIEIDDIQIDISVWNRKIEQCHIEMRYFLDFVKRYCLTEEDTQKYFDLNAEEEHKYWIARMAKQTSIDIITTGRLGPGNLDSVLMMPEEDQVKTLQLALNYAGAVNAGVDALKESAEKSIRFLRDEIPNNKFLEENSNVTSEKKSLQSTDKSETSQ